MYRQALCSIILFFSVSQVSSVNPLCHVPLLYDPLALFPATKRAEINSLLNNASSLMNETIINDLIDEAAGTLAGENAKLFGDFTTENFIIYYGYLAKSYVVITLDGYVITIFRLFSKTKSPTMGPVLVASGLGGSSDQWVMNNYSLAYELVEAGFDVWLFNSRGSTYGRDNVNPSLDPNRLSDGFWKFSWDKIGEYDLPPIIDRVLYETGKSRIYYIGYSQGTTILFVCLSKWPEYNAKIIAAAQMAPGVYGNNVSSYVKIYFGIALLLWPYRHTEFQSSSKFEKQLNNILCASEDVSTYCNQGMSEAQRNKGMELVYKQHTCSYSIDQYIHTAQTLNFNYFGPYMHDMCYPAWPISTVPANFPVELVTAPMALHYSPGDSSTDQADINKLIVNCPGVFYAKAVNSSTFTHTDFPNGIGAPELVYKYVIQSLIAGSDSSTLPQLRENLLASVN